MSIRIIDSLTMQATSSADRLGELQAGLSAPTTISATSMNYIIVITGAIVLTFMAAGVISWRRKRSRVTKGWSSITNSQNIWEVLSKAVARQAHFSLDIYEATRTINFKGVLTGLEDESYLVLTLSETPSADAELAELPGVIHINFRPAVKEPTEHFQFATKVMDYRFVKDKDWREAQILIPIPKVVTSAQRRSFLRLEPTGQFAISCALHEVPEGNIPDLGALDVVCSGEIMDISIGGAQIKLSNSLTLRETQRFVGVMALPTQDLNVELSEPNLIVLIQLLSQEYVQQSVQLGQSAHNILRVRFLGRYLKDKNQNIWTYRGLTQSTLEDLSYWLLAYQRYLIKKKLYLLPPLESHRPPNMFPAQPPKRPPLRGEDD
ncbi:MAG: hypothetical protein LBJ64_12960 [Deltaproteobacteria bacterium]|jgi:hypothetical protein|nr:hypothetical protein [Deltaproteobacteria bacterium]